MELWHKQNLDQLIGRIVDQFLYLYKKCTENNDEIYGMTIHCNSFCITSYLAVASHSQLKEEYDELKWQLDEWVITVDDGVYADDFLDQFNKDIRDYFGEIMLPKLQNGADEKEETEKNIQFYIVGMKKAKESLVNILGLEIENIVFILSVDEHPDVALRSALEINSYSDSLQEFVEYKNQNS
ncbi:DUF4303 domain-containing protein [Chryseobacterium sp. BIGb0232]|uniref:DUF4303 domain-containing protein n=1 Tax=Chryseobacterium sp. BIGb0232 TaxID=2940598 RepID=UPI000F4607D1|nr:DUF4303 domain-containing protein [Chryseobacterium sp. BIGb0232]MCS4302623.1 hypothetical protein [Chryseobacterium sp. BIGb0232]ROS17277.1 uncharacterized protein DUF4303 [Chryseobacterium nakagawai]